MKFTLISGTPHEGGHKFALWVKESIRICHKASPILSPLSQLHSSRQNCNQNTYTIQVYERYTIVSAECPLKWTNEMRELNNRTETNQNREATHVYFSLRTWTLFNSREFKKLRRQLKRKRDLKIELCVKLSLLRLFHVGHLVQIGRVHFCLLDTNGFQVKAKNKRFTAASLRCRQSLKYENFTSSFGRLRQNNAPNIVPHVQHDYFSSFNQSNHWFVVVLLTLPSSNLKLPSYSSRTRRIWADIYNQRGRRPSWLSSAHIRQVREE